MLRSPLRSALVLAGALALLAAPARAQLRVLDVHRLLPTSYWDECVKLYGGQRVSIALRDSRPPTVVDHGKILQAMSELEWGEAAGYTADGVSLLLLAFRAPEPGCVTFEVYDQPLSTSPPLAAAASVGHLRNSFRKFEVENGMVVWTRTFTYWNAVLNQLVEEDWAFAELMAPEDFVRNASDESLPVRGVNIEATFRTMLDCGSPFYQSVTNRSLVLVRPRVVMVHGIFSDNDMWDDQGWGSFFNPPSPYAGLDVLRVDYSGTSVGVPGFPPTELVQQNARSFAANRAIVPKGIAAAIKARREAGIATTKVDLIGHSMGGILGRLYAEDMHEYQQGVPPGYRYFRPDNFRSGDIHKLITLSSPHRGSQWSDLIDFLADLPGARNLIRKLGAAVDMPPFQGAAMDMCTDSFETLHMRMAMVPSHALVATGGKAVSTAVGSAIEEYVREVMWFMSPYTWVSWFVDMPSLINGPYMFDGLEHDLVVSQPSQQGGLSGNNVTIYATPMLEMTHSSAGNRPMLCGGSPSCWVGVGSSPTMATRFLSLLNAKLASSFADRLPAHPQAPPWMPFPPPPSGGGSHQPGPPMELIGLEFIAPLGGSSVAAGSTLMVNVATLQNYAPQYIAIVVDGEIYEPVLDASTGNYDAQVTIPLDALGDVKLQALAIDAASRISSAQVTVHATLPVGATLLALSVDPSSIELWNATPTAQVRVTGVYDDAERDLTGHPGVVYESASPSIADVSSTGLVTGSALGLADVSVSYAGFTKHVLVEVNEIKGDHDGDGDVDQLDFGAFMQCFTGSIEDPSYENDSNTCLFTFDLDGDVDVDAADYDLFLAAFTGVLGRDCNVNGADDMDDIFGGFSTDCDHDGVPDDCSSIDCNGNGLPDSCDVEPQDEGFADAQTYASASTVAPRTVAIGDFNGDGHRDVAVCHPAGAISVLMNDGGGAFGSSNGNGFIPTGTHVTTIAAADIDGGDDDELLVCADNPGNASGDYLLVKSNAPLGLFQNSVSIQLPISGMPSGSGPRALAVGDFNSDGKTDVAIVIGTAAGVTPAGGKVFVLLNTSTATTISFSSSIGQLNAQSGARAIIATDVDRDAKLDLVVANYHTVTPIHSVVILKGLGTGGFAGFGSRTTYTTFEAPLALAAGDMNGDGWPEIAVANEFTGDIDLLVNRGIATAGQFLTPPASAVAVTIDPRAMVAGDLDGDGRTELVVTDAALGEIQVLSMLSVGCRFAGTIAADQLSFQTPTAPIGVALGRIDGDLDLDVVTSNLAPEGMAIHEVNVLSNTVILPFSHDADADGVPDECFPDWNNNGQFDSCDIAQGLLPDCNHNLLPDGSEALTPAVDCNGNLVLDACEIEGGSAADCDQNGVIDSCDIAAGAPDCNGNGIPDSCDVDSLYSETSDVLHGVYFGTSKSWTFVSPPLATNDPEIPVKLRFVANADFAAAFHRITIRVNGTNIGDAYTGNYNGCDSPFGPDTFEMTLTPTSYNLLKGTGNVVITMTPGGTAQTGMQECLGAPSWIQLTLEYSDAESFDSNDNGVPDECPGG